MTTIAAPLPSQGASPPLRRIFLSASALFILAVAALMSSPSWRRAAAVNDNVDVGVKSSESSWTDASAGSRAPAQIKYEAVTIQESASSSKGAYLRFAAYERAEDNAEWEPLNVQRWAQALARDSPMASQHRDNLTRILSDSPYKAFFFETKGASSDTAPRKQFEFVLVDTPYLRKFAEGSPDPNSFREHLDCTPDDRPGCAFVSLSGDATLVAPRKEGGGGVGEEIPYRAYSHIAAFVREAPPGQVNRLWRLVGEEYLKALDRGLVWLSTDGTGVAWLHVRLDTRPKYYSYSEFAKAT